MDFSPLFHCLNGTLLYALLAAIQHPSFDIIFRRLHAISLQIFSYQLLQYSQIFLLLTTEATSANRVYLNNLDLKNLRLNHRVYSPPDHVPQFLPRGM